MTDFDWEKAAEREHDRMVDELNDLREAKTRVEAESYRFRKALEKINMITENIPEVSGGDKLTMQHDEALTEICILTRNTLAGERDASGGKEPHCEICGYLRKALESCPDCGKRREGA